MAYIVGRWNVYLDHVSLVILVKIWICINIRDFIIVVERFDTVGSYVACHRRFFSN